MSSKDTNVDRFCIKQRYISIGWFCVKSVCCWFCVGWGYRCADMFCVKWRYEGVAGFVSSGGTGVDMCTLITATDGLQAV